MKNIILVANNDEAKHIKDLESDNCKIIITGEGRSNVITTIARQIKDRHITDDDMIINVGYVGSPRLYKGEIVCINKVQPFIPSLSIIEPSMDLVTDKITSLKFTQCYTSDNFVNKEDYENNNITDFNSVCDMELYWITLMLNNVLSIKIVSDNCDYDDYTQADFKESWETVRNKLKEIL